QQLEHRLADIDAELHQLSERELQLRRQAEELKLEVVQRDLLTIGLPSNNYITHSAMVLEYAEAYEQARWVAHIIRPEITKGTVGRTNDFREDPLVSTGTAVEADYFLKYEQPDGTFEYDGFGYDRGHLAPSADFRWSEKALSESYFYSNMSPQRAEFNRGGWADLEGLLRGYLYEHPGTQLYVVTGPILHENLPVIERGVNKVAIPEQYFKVAVDVQNRQAIGFILPNQRIPYPISSYAVSVDEVEQLTGLDFFPNLTEEATIEATFNRTHWIPELAAGDAEPIYMPSLPPGHFNTVHARRHAGTGKVVTIVGKVVSSRYSRSGNLWLNLDKKFPNQVFSVFIRKKDLVNFSYDPQKVLEGQTITVKGTVEDFNGVPTMNIDREERVGEYFSTARK
ncbi:MAG: DNA/RNA non-specific endonuclease, partial [Bacteroidota bacterium]